MDILDSSQNQDSLLAHAPIYDLHWERKLRLHQGTQRHQGEEAATKHSVMSLTFVELQCLHLTPVSILQLGGIIPRQKHNEGWVRMIHHGQWLTIVNS